MLHRQSADHGSAIAEACPSFWADRLCKTLCDGREIGSESGAGGSGDEYTYRSIYVGAWIVFVMSLIQSIELRE